jgi:hypothetical protein
MGKNAFARFIHLLSADTLMHYLSHPSGDALMRYAEFQVWKALAEVEVGMCRGIEAAETLMQT